MNTVALIHKDWKRVESTFTFFISACTTVLPPPPSYPASEFHLILDSVSVELRWFTESLLWHKAFLWQQLQGILKWNVYRSTSNPV